MLQVTSIGAALGYIYLIRCLLTGQRYVGQTTMNPFARFAAHLARPSGKMKKVVAARRAEDLQFEVIDEAADRIAGRRGGPGQGGGGVTG
jgi:hypothetical protein